MPTARYFIVREQDEWLIRFDGEEYGPYRSREEAMLFAVEAARKLGTYGEAAEVCLMGENGHFRPEWTAGRGASPQQP